MHAHLGSIARRAGHLVLSEPIVCSLVTQHSPAMRVDGDTVIVRPNFPGM